MRKKTLTPTIKSTQQEDFVFSLVVVVLVLLCLGFVWLISIMGGSQ